MKLVYFSKILYFLSIIIFHGLSLMCYFSYSLELIPIKGHVGSHFSPYSAEKSIGDLMGNHLSQWDEKSP